MIKPTEEPRWRRSRRCSHGACVEVARTTDRFLVRDSKNPDTAPIAFTQEQWTAFVAGVKAGTFSF
jgi:predicted secreted Zn-dependent protease